MPVPGRREQLYRGELALGIAFDGTNIWVANRDDDTVSVINASTGTLVHTISLGGSPYSVGYDGLNMWVADDGDNKVYEINGAGGGTVLNTFTAGSSNSRDVVFDGTNIWVGSRGALTKFPRDKVRQPLYVNLNRKGLPVRPVTLLFIDGTTRLGPNYEVSG